MVHYVLIRWLPDGKIHVRVTSNAIGGQNEINYITAASHSLHRCFAKLKESHEPVSHEANKIQLA